MKTVAKKHGTTQGGARLPGVPVHGRRRRRLGAKHYFRPTGPRSLAKFGVDVPQGEAVHDRQGVRRLGEGAEDALLGRRRLRSDLFDGQEMTLRRPAPSGAVRAARAVRVARGETHPGLHARLSAVARHHPALDAVRSDGAAGVDGIHRCGHVAAGDGGVQAECRRVGDRGAGERRVRPARGVGADAIQVPGQVDRRRAGGSSVRAADGGGGGGADDALRPERDRSAGCSRRTGSRWRSRRSASRWR